MAQPAQSLQRLRQYLKDFNADLWELTQIRADIIDQGGGDWIQAAAEADGLTKQQVVAVAAAINAVNDTLDATSKTYRKAVLAVEA
jgi:hypothetical protein